MRGVNGEIRWILAAIRKLPEGMREEQLYSIDFSDVFSLEGLSYSRSVE